jgi:hypothetical protein
MEAYVAVHKRQSVLPLVIMMIVWPGVESQQLPEYL